MTPLPNSAQDFFNRGMALAASGSYAAAIAHFERAIAARSDFVPAHLLRAKLLADLRRYDDALAGIDKLLVLAPNLAEAWLGRSNILFETGRYGEALAACERALALKPDLAEAWLGRGNVLAELKRYHEALAAYDRALALNPQFAGAMIGRGNVFNAIKRYGDALAAYDKALVLAPGFAEAWLGRGNVLNALKCYDEAFAAFDRALALVPNLVEARFGRGNVFAAVKRHSEAAIAYAEVLKIDPQHAFTKGFLLHQKMLACDWSGIGPLIADIDRDVAAGKPAAEPFGWQAAATSPQSLQRCAELYNADRYPAVAVPPPPSLITHEKIRVGYVSGEFREQATSHLIVGVLEKHDPSRFEIFCVDNGWDDRSEIRKRINAAAQKIVDISKFGDAAAVAAIREHKIDILVNLNGYFGEHRMPIFARRPAPIQVNYLGFPGTLGAGYIDYIIADRHVIPEEHKGFYCEKVAYLPNCYQANDRNKAIAENTPDRRGCGLPEGGFVFSCFNNNYKILPEIFDCWMRILSRVDGSVLWLFEDNEGAALNLRKEAAARKVNPERLVFAKRMPLADHLARHRLADLFVDTLPYNAHTTASDALWAGLPLLTCRGATFPGRVASSLLDAVGLPELITRTLEAYERLAVELATHPEKLAAIKSKLADSRLTTPLFDTGPFTRHIEAAYAAMYERARAGLAPDHIDIAN